MKNYLYFVIALTGLISCESIPEPGTTGHIDQVTSAVNTEAIQNTDHTDWLSYGLNYEEDRYSRLDQINKDNLDQLELAWSYDMGVMRGVEASSIVIDGIMYTTGPWSVVYAIDARQGSLLWKYDPEVPRDYGEKACCDVINRGVALSNGDIFFGTIDGRLVSIDATTGDLNWEVMTVPADRSYTITGAPRIVKDMVVIGNGGAEYDARGFVSAYSLDDGELRWRFYTVPGDPSKEPENTVHSEIMDTWTGEWWTMGGGGTVWDAIVYDPEQNSVYIGVGNGAPWDRDVRSPGGGDNLFLSSIVALDADDGSYKWHYQTTPGDTWDYTATQPIILADLEIDGATRQVLMQAPKNGFFYVIDRTNGELISAEPYTAVNWATGIDDNGRPIEAPTARYADGRNHVIAPGPFGGHNWQPMAYNHETGYVYIPSHAASAMYSKNEKFAYNESDGGAASAGGWNVTYAHQLYRPIAPDPDVPNPLVPYGRLIAWDPVEQEEKWAQEMPLTHWNGGVLTTAGGLVIQGNATGHFTIYDAEDGKVLWDRDLKTGIIAPPVTYMIDGEQYISIPVGWGGIVGLSRKYTEHTYPGRIYTFKLNGTGVYPDYPEMEAPQFTSMKPKGSQIDIGHGLTLYIEHCVQCHGDQFGNGGGALPDLSRSSDQVYASYDKILREGLLSENGMPDFGERLSAKDAEDIKQFFLYTAQEMRSGTDPMSYLTNIATMQYMADSHYSMKD